jgi:hypothetical protein
MVQIFSFLVYLSSVLNLVAASNVIDLTPANFDEIVGSGKPALVCSIVEPRMLIYRLSSSLLGISSCSAFSAQLLIVRCGHWYVFLLAFNVIVKLLRLFMNNWQMLFNMRKTKS